MEKHTELSDKEFERKFIACEFDPRNFSHEAHLRLAWINIKRYGLEQAELNVQDQLQNFVEFVGAKDKYNKTLTIAAIKAVDHFIRKSKAAEFSDFINEFPRLKYNFKELMATHYGFDVFNSTAAKKEFIAPDLVPFD